VWRNELESVGYGGSESCAVECLSDKRLKGARALEENSQFLRKWLRDSSPSPPMRSTAISDRTHPAGDFQDTTILPLSHPILRAQHDDHAKNLHST